jgi:hypothetical protein
VGCIWPVNISRKTGNLYSSKIFQMNSPNSKLLSGANETCFRGKSEPQGFGWQPVY